MAEIKSTLELVMERTRHLKLTEEDKREQALAEFKGGLGGLLQKVQDGVLGLDRFRVELGALQGRTLPGETATVIEELAARLGLDGDNGWVLKLLGGACEVNTDELAAVFHDYRQACENLDQTRTGEFRKDLLARYGIRGSAVIPNLAADPAWATERQQLRERFELVMRQAVTRLKAGERVG